jgi:methylthioribose-1-phosphate isomerase
MTAYRSIEWRQGVLRLLDQRLLPQQTEYLDFIHYQEVAIAIQDMVIRGAPAIGAAAAYGLALAAIHSDAKDLSTLRGELETAAGILQAARPTAVNLVWAIKRVFDRLSDPKLVTIPMLQEATISEANKIAEEDIWVCKQIGLNALPFVPPVATVIHHCNTGSLATVDYGTALGIIRTAHEHGRKIEVLVDETRPRLQGARLTAWELSQLGIPHTVIVDGASGHFMRTRHIDFCVVGCDRVAANGDTANKIGTYNLAIVAHAHGVPFYVAAPTSTIDMTQENGDTIPIEERPSAEVEMIGDHQITPTGVRVANPAFDVTPAKFITAIITEKGVAFPPFSQSLAEIMKGSSPKNQSSHPG